MLPFAVSISNLSVGNNLIEIVLFDGEGASVGYSAIISISPRKYLHSENFSVFRVNQILYIGFPYSV